MAYHDALFQLGMDLTRSSTAHEEDLDGTARVVHDDNDQQEDRKDFFIERDGVRYAGNHLIIDLFGAQRLDDIEHVEHTLKKCVDTAGASLLHIHLHHFTPNGGVSGVAVLSESHISIHSWPEADYAALVGVSPLTIYNWESGKTRPGGPQMAAWATIRGLGKREAWKRLEDLEA